MNPQHGTLTIAFLARLAAKHREQGRHRERTPGKASPRVLGASGGQPSASACENEISRMNSRQGTLRSEFPARQAVNLQPKHKQE